MKVDLAKYLGRVSSSERDERFNPLIWPFLLATFSYGIGFTVFAKTDAVNASSLWQAMEGLNTYFPFTWGVLCVTTILIGFTFLLYNIPPAGKISGLVGFMLWVFATICWLFSDGIILVFAIGIPNMWFWFWQYLSLTEFRRQDAEDKQTMVDYDAGLYDDGNGGKAARENNRGVEPQ